MLHYITVDGIAGRGYRGNGLDLLGGILRMSMAVLWATKAVIKAAFSRQSLDRFYRAVVCASSAGMPSFDEARRDFNEAVAYRSLVETDARL